MNTRFAEVGGCPLASAVVEELDGLDGQFGIAGMVLEDSGHSLRRRMHATLVLHHVRKQETSSNVPRCLCEQRAQQHLRSVRVTCLNAQASQRQAQIAAARVFVQRMLKHACAGCRMSTEYQASRGAEPDFLAGTGERLQQTVQRACGGLLLIVCQRSQYTIIG